MNIAALSLNERFVDLLRQLDQSMNQLLREIVGDFSLNTMMILISISFIYGILHALGPGHGKAVIASFFLKEKQKYSRAVLLSAFISAVHTGTAIILSFLLYYVLTGIRGMFRIQLQSYFIIASGIMITAIGLLFLGLKLFYRGKESTREKWQKRNFFLVGFSAGMIPCPVSSMILLLTLTHNIVYVGFITVASISLGMFLVLSVVGTISIASRSGIMIASGKIFNKAETVAQVIEYLSIVLIILLGSGMALSMLLVSSGSPF